MGLGAVGPIRTDHAQNKKQQFFLQYEPKLPDPTIEVRELPLRYTAMCIPLKMKEALDVFLRIQSARAYIRFCFF